MASTRSVSTSRTAAFSRIAFVVKIFGGPSAAKALHARQRRRRLRTTARRVSARMFTLRFLKGHPFGNVRSGPLSGQ